MKKTLLVLSSILAMSLVFVGCPKDPKDPPSSAPAEPVVIEYTDNIPIAKNYDYNTKEFSNYQVNIECLKDIKLEKGQKVVVVEDLISTGGSCIEVVDVLREAGAEVLGIVSIFTYGMQKGLTRLAEADVKNVSLTNFDVIAEVAAEDGYIEKDDVKRLIAFRNNPSDESWIGAK